VQARNMWNMRYIIVLHNAVIFETNQLWEIYQRFPKLDAAARVIDTETWLEINIP